MDAQSDMPLKLEVVSAENMGRYRVTARSEVVHLLREMIDQRSFIRAFLPDKVHSFLTGLISVEEDKDRIVFDMPMQVEVSELIEPGSQLTMSTAVNRVQIQFITTVERKSSVNGLSAIYGKIPKTVMRLQRREYFRLTSPAVMPVTCEMPQKMGKPRKFNVFDIGIGGAAILDVPIDQAGTVLEDVCLNLPDEGVIVANLVVRNVFNVTMRNGATVRRVGCAFEGLTMPMQNMIQRYILRVERERKARERKLD